MTNDHAPERMSFNTFPVEAHVAGWQRGPALVWEMTPGEAPANWLYWAIYNLHVAPPTITASSIVRSARTSGGSCSFSG